MITLEQLKAHGASAAQIAMFMQEYPSGSVDNIMEVALICGPAWTARVFLTEDQLKLFAEKAVEEVSKTELCRRNAIHDHCKSLASIPDPADSARILQQRLNIAFYNLESAMAEWVDYYYCEPVDRENWK